jgi:hypothetical protein
MAESSLLSKTNVIYVVGKSPLFVDENYNPVVAACEGPG